jgi:NAD+ synthase (glutamine-hydrolysing)
MVTRMPLELSATSGSATEPLIAAELAQEAELYTALELALADYVTKNGFKRVVIGLSGGIDSALTATIAADALGPDHVLAVAMPSSFSTSHSLIDAKELAANLGIDLFEIPIAAIYDAYAKVIDEAIGSRDAGLAEENLQARIRGNLLMFISNRDGHLVLATGNKSEGACGYATLYGDMAGGFALIKDVFKQEVYALARYRNSISQVIPSNILTKAPSAELRPDQRDEDSLPPYPVLDPILEAYIERDASVEDIVRSGAERSVVEEVISLVDRAEYKRRQAPPGPKVTTKAFGRDRRLPISNGWREGTQIRFPARVVGEREPE